MSQVWQGQKRQKQRKEGKAKGEGKPKVEGENNGKRKGRGKGKTKSKLPGKGFRSYWINTDWDPWAETADACGDAPDTSAGVADSQEHQVYNSWFVALEGAGFSVETIAADSAPAPQSTNFLISPAEVSSPTNQSSSGPLEVSSADIPSALISPDTQFFLIGTAGTVASGKSGRQPLKQASKQGRAVPLEEKRKETQVSARN